MIKVGVCVVPVRVNREERINAHRGPEAVLSQGLQRLQPLARGGAPGSIWRVSSRLMLEE